MLTEKENIFAYSFSQYSNCVYQAIKVTRHVACRAIISKGLRGKMENGHIWE